MAGIKIKNDKDEILLELLEKELGFYRVTLELSRAEHQKFCNKRPMTEILSIMKKRKIILECIDEIEEQVRPLKKEWESKGELKSFISEDIQEILKTLEDIIKEIIALSEENGRMLEQHMYLLTEQHEAIISKKET
jgi:hypothetical protein